MRFLVRLKATGIPEADLLEAIRALAKPFGADPRNPKWASYGALELDVFVPARTDFELFMAAVGPLAKVEFTTDLNLAPPHREEAELLSDARALFNSERFWECHEVLEGIWRNKQGDEKRVLQGIILVCAAFVHHQKGEDDIGLGILRRGIRQLDHPGPYGGFDVTTLRGEVGKVLKAERFSNFRV